VVQVGRLEVAAATTQFVPLHEYGGCSAGAHMARGDLGLSAVAGGGPHLTAWLPDEQARRVVAFGVSTQSVVALLPLPATARSVLHTRHFAARHTEWVATIVDDDLLLHSFATPA
jgi:hypothetical protein